MINQNEDIVPINLHLNNMCWDSGYLGVSIDQTSWDRALTSLDKTQVSCVIFEQCLLMDFGCDIKHNLFKQSCDLKTLCYPGVKIGSLLYNQMVNNGTFCIYILVYFNLIICILQMYNIGPICTILVRAKCMLCPFGVADRLCGKHSGH